MLNLLYKTAKTKTTDFPTPPLQFEEIRLEIVTDPVINAIARPEFEDGLWTGVFPGGYWYHCGECIKPKNNSNSLFGCGLILWAVWLSYEPLSNQIPTYLLSSKHQFVFKLQQLCGVRIEPA